MSVPARTAALAAQTSAEQARIVDPIEAALIEAWSRTWRELEPEFEQALAAILSSKGAGRRVRPSQMARARRLVQTLAHARQAVATILSEHGEAVSAALPEVVDAALRGHQAMAASQLPPSGVGLAFDQIDTAQVDAIVARSLQQITTTHLRLPAEIERDLRSALIRGVSVGENPLETGRRIVHKAGTAFNGGLPRAQMIARTEMLDAGRAAARAWEERNTDIVAGWTWMAALDRRTCPACLAMHGTDHPITETGPDGHPNCRCTRMPRTKSWEELGFPGIPDTGPTMQTGTDWLADQTETTQDHMLGRTRADAWRAGRVDLADMVTVRHTPDWRRSHVATPIRDLPMKERA